MQEICRWCGKEFETLKREKYCCEDCRKKAAKDRKKKATYFLKEKADYSMPEICYSCYYQRNLSSSVTQGKCCLYILIEGKMRGCPGDENCDKFKPKNEKRYWDFAGRGW